MSSEDNVNSGQLNVSTGQSKDHINYDFLQVKSHPVCDRISGSGSGSGQSGQYFPIRFRFRFRPNFGRIGRILKNNSKVFQNAKNVAILVYWC